MHLDMGNFCVSHLQKIVPSIGKFWTGSASTLTWARYVNYYITSVTWYLCYSILCDLTGYFNTPMKLITQIDPRLYDMLPLFYLFEPSRPNLKQKLTQKRNCKGQIGSLKKNLGQWTFIKLNLKDILYAFCKYNRNLWQLIWYHWRLRSTRW